MQRSHNTGVFVVYKVLTLTVLGNFAPSFNACNFKQSHVNLLTRSERDGVTKQVVKSELMIERVPKLWHLLVFLMVKELKLEC